jgi:heme/copper-type cytochrome/quinol oxidase subunit 3
LRRDLQFSPNLYQVGITVGLFSISAFFIALILAYSFRIEASGSWQRFHVPSFLWLSTVLLGISSWLLEAGRYALRRAHILIYRGRLLAAIFLGCMFLALQVTAGVNLFHQGVTTEANPHGSAFYVFMGIHGIHLTVGLCWLEYLHLRSGRLVNATENDLRKHRAVASVAATYWHFMGILWGVLFFFLLRWSR